MILAVVISSHPESPVCSLDLAGEFQLLIAITSTHSMK